MFARLPSRAGHFGLHHGTRVPEILGRRTGNCKLHNKLHLRIWIPDTWCNNWKCLYSLVISILVIICISECSVFITVNKLLKAPIRSGSQIFFQLDYVYFTCPEGFVFQGSKNVTHYAVCRNWKFVYLFDLTKPCVGKFHEKQMSQSCLTTW